MVLSNVKQKCGPLPPGSAVNLDKLKLNEIELFIKMLYGVWSSLQPDHDGRCGFLFFGFLAPGFLAKIKQVRFLSGSLRSPDVNEAILYVSILLSIQVKLQCGILDF